MPQLLIKELCLLSRPAVEKKEEPKPNTPPTVGTGLPLPVTVKNAGAVAGANGNGGGIIIY